VNRYDVGDMVQLTGSFVDESGEPTDPTTLALRIRRGDGSVVVVPPEEITSAGEGEFAYDLHLADIPGVWSYVYEGEDAVAQAAMGEFRVTGTVSAGRRPTTARTIYHHYGDTRPPLRVLLRNPDGTLADLDDATVELVLRPAGQHTTYTFDASVVEDMPGVVEYNWEGEESLFPWTYIMHWRVTYVEDSDESSQTFPSRDVNRLIVKGPLEEESS